MHWLVEILLLTLFLLYLLHLYISRNFDYWQKRNVPFIKPRPFVGNMLDMFLQKYDMGSFFQKLYQDIEAPFFGIFVFSKPALVIKDLNLVKHILVKDFDHFVDRCMYAPEHEPATAHMLFIEKGDEWRTMRAKMSPFFSPLKLKCMFGNIDNLAKALCNHIAVNTEKSDSEHRFTTDAKDISCKYSVDVIAKCVFGIDSNSLEIENGEFLNVAHKVFDPRPITTFRFLCYFFFHSFARTFKMKLFDPEVIRFLRRVFWECIRVREESGVRGNDLIDVIVDLRKDKKFCERIHFEGDKVIAQAFIFFAAGFETTGSAIATTLYSLCLKPDIQRQVRNNIQEVMKKRNGELTIDAIEEMSYLDMAVKETLRKYCPVPILDRACTKEYRIPETDVVLEKGMFVFIPLFGIQKDPNYFSQPEEYIPERFESINKEDMSYLPFGNGPRNCIGRRFGLLATKLALIRILNEFEVHSTAETPVPIVFSTSSTIPQPTEKLMMNFVKTESLF